MNTSEDFHNNNFGVFLQAAGYNTGWFGKYLNNNQIFIFLNFYLCNKRNILITLIYLNYPGIVNFCNVSDPGHTPPGWNFVNIINL